MCLNVYGKNLLRLKAQNDIRCYKIMGISKNGTLITPYTNFPMKKGKLYEDKENENIKYGCVITKKSYFNNFARNYGYMIHEGFFHTFVRNADANINCDKLNRIRLNKDVIYHVYPCIIPSGSEYIKGNYFNHEPVFASKKLMILDD